MFLVIFFAKIEAQGNLNCVQLANRNLTFLLKFSCKTLSVMFFSTRVSLAGECSWETAKLASP